MRRYANKTSLCLLPASEKLCLLVSVALVMCAPHICLSIDVNNEYDSIAELGPKQLFNFKGVGSQQVFHWPITFPNSSLLVKIVAHMNQSGGIFSVKCPPSTVLVLMRENALPIPNPHNTTIPDTVIIQSDGLLYSGNFTVIPTASDMPTNHSIYLKNLTLSECSGNLFISVFLPKKDDTLDVSGLSNNCEVFAKAELHRKSSMKTLQRVPPPHKHAHTNSTLLIRKQISLFDVQFLTNISGYLISDNASYLFHWHLLPITDSGGTLRLTLQASSHTTVKHALVHGCLRHGSPPNGICNDTSTLMLNNSIVSDKAELQIPFPQAGLWFLEFRLGIGMKSVLLNFSVGVTMCPDDCHDKQKQGVCQLYHSDEILFGACECKAGWQGIACTDIKTALSYNQQLLRTLLLTLSNVMFVPCVALAMYRRFYSEAIVYAFVWFMSTFYHACDQPGITEWCLTDFDTLQYSDFLSSLAAIWYTLIAMARTNCPSLEGALHIGGMIVIATTVADDRFCLWTFILPIVVGHLVLLVSWGGKLYRSKQCFPGKRVVLFSVLPGSVFALAGVVLYGFVQTDENYLIVHSLWHVCVAAAALFLLPAHRETPLKSGSISNSNEVGLCFDQQEAASFDKQRVFDLANHTLSSLHGQEKDISGFSKQDVFNCHESSHSSGLISIDPTSIN